MQIPEDYVRIQYADGYYWGQVAADGSTENGHGMFAWDNGNVYIGDFRNGTLCGKGRYVWADGRIYEGEFLDDTISGKGVMTWPSGDRYEGDFANGVMVGKGVRIFASGDRYEGQFKDNLMDGEGRYYATDGSIVYDGPWIGGCAINTDDPRLKD